ncbi:hypothetical protein FRE64_05010 [Euhalothece natronophila Z-M001]|uniref:Uncharacterized protein n=1 Tax=Euhalothece natronophila Z-M001 TaxID=522448 RepID=A0A5B8NJ98_9CHRO|nr:hypothetical protein [Euhalothece natronophila]QDZ39342.1 hypothetical protein FRE64_05010 [Euhalothece natronophila Z-M001]
MVISNLDHLSVVSEKEVKGGLALANALTFSTAIGNAFSSTFTNAQTGVISAIGFKSSASLSQASAAANV